MFIRGYNLMTLLPAAMGWEKICFDFGQKGGGLGIFFGKTWGISLDRVFYSYRKRLNILQSTPIITHL
jgi:hypothetical protein